MSRQMQGSKKALMFLTASRWERRRHGDVPVESSVLFHQCEAMKRKAEQLDADIIEKFAIPKQSDLLAHPLFRGMLQVISNQGIDYVLIYPNRPHRNRERSAVITAAINRAGAQVVSSQNVQNVTVLPEHLYEILAWLNDTNTTQRRDAQLRRQWERKKRTSQAA